MKSSVLLLMLDVAVFRIRVVRLWYKMYKYKITSTYAYEYDMRYESGVMDVAFVRMNQSIAGKNSLQEVCVNWDVEVRHHNFNIPNFKIITIKTD